MIEEKTYIENIKEMIETNIVETKKRNIQIENNRLLTYYNIGKEIVKAEKEDKIKYGNSFIKEMSNELTRLYGRGFDYTNLRKMKQFFNNFSNCASLKRNFAFISWTHIKLLLPIKNENKRNYYINLVNENYLSVRELRRQIKANAHERQDEDVKKNIKLNSSKKPSVTDLIKEPLLLDINETLIEHLNEKALKKVILNQIEKFLLELGAGFAFVGSENKSRE